MATKLKSRKGVLNNMWDELPMGEETVVQEVERPAAKAKEPIPAPVENKESVVKEVPAAKVKEAPAKSKGNRLDTKDILNKKERVAISLTGTTKKRLEKISAENAVSISSAIQLIVLSYNENPTHYYKEDTELLGDVEKVTNFDSLSFSDLGKKTCLTEEEKRVTSQYTLAPAIDRLIADKTAQFGLPIKMRSRVYNAIIDRYLDVKKL